VSSDFDEERKANKARIAEYVQTIERKEEQRLKLEKAVHDLQQSLAAKQREHKELYFGVKERDKQLTHLKMELSNSSAQRAEKETVLSGRDTKILRLELDLQKMRESQSTMGHEKRALSDKLARSNQEIESLNQKIQIISDQLLSSQHNSSTITSELAQSNERLKAENASLKRQNDKIQAVTQEMKQAIAQLHELAAIDKQNNGVNVEEMQCLLDENEKLQKELHSMRGKLKERERELAMLKREKSRLHEISNRFHHQLTLREFDPSPSENDNASDLLNVDDLSRGDDFQSQSVDDKDKLMRKIEELKASLSHGGGRGEDGSDLSLVDRRLSDPAPVSSSRGSSRSIRYKHDEIRRKLNSGMNASKSKKSKHPKVRNWNHR